MWSSAGMMEGVFWTHWAGVLNHIPPTTDELSDLNNRINYLQASSIEKSTAKGYATGTHDFISFCITHSLPLNPTHKLCCVTLLTLPNSLVWDWNICQAHGISYPTFIPLSMLTNLILLYEQQLSVQRRYGWIQSTRKLPLQMVHPQDIPQSRNTYQRLQWLSFCIIHPAALWMSSDRRIST